VTARAISGTNTHSMHVWNVYYNLITQQANTTYM